MSSPLFPLIKCVVKPHIDDNATVTTHRIYIYIVSCVSMVASPSILHNNTATLPTKTKANFTIHISQSFNKQKTKQKSFFSSLFLLSSLSLSIMWANPHLYRYFIGDLEPYIFGKIQIFRNISGISAPLKTKSRQRGRWNGGNNAPRHKKELDLPAHTYTELEL